MLTLVVARHGQTEHNATRRLQGHCDAPLTAKGVAQAKRIGAQLAPYVERDAVRIVTSDLGRAMRTAAIAFPGRVTEIDARLRELGFGRFEGLTHDECRTIDQAAYRAWVADPETHTTPGGESLDSLRTRVRSFLDDLPLSGTVIAITHGGPAFMLLSTLLRIPFDAARRAGLSHGDAVRFTVPAQGPVPLPVWLSDEVAARTLHDARQRMDAATTALNEKE